MTAKTIVGHGLNLTSLANCNLVALDALLARYAEIGCTHVEVSARRLDMISGGRIIESRAEEVAEILSRHRLRLVLHASHAINFMDLTNAEMHRSVARASIVLAGRMDMASVVIHSGWVPSDVWLASRDTLMRTEREALTWLGDLAAEAGTRLALENLIADPKGTKTHYGADPRAVADQIEAVGHPALGGCLDFGHALISAPVLGFDFVQAVAALSEQAWHLHLHDNCGIPSTGAIADIGDQVAFGIGDLHCPMGWGTIPWEVVLPRMRFRPGTCAMVELQGRYRGMEDIVAETARRFAAYWNGEISLAAALPGSGSVKEAAE